MTRWLERSQPYLPHVRRVFTKYGLPQDLVLLPFTESGYTSGLIRGPVQAECGSS